MAILLFRLNNVPEDEAQDIRELLAQHAINFYETDAGFFRVGLDAIWLTDRQQEEEARALIYNYQQERTARFQENRALLEAAGDLPGFWQNARAHPVRLLGAALALVFVLGVTLVPFVMLLTR